jgi:hypothetical protein
MQKSPTALYQMDEFADLAPMEPVEDEYPAPDAKEFLYASANDEMISAWVETYTRHMTDVTKKRLVYAMYIDQTYSSVSFPQLTLKEFRTLKRTILTEMWDVMQGGTI